MVPPSEAPEGAFLCEYDDGNGMWITFVETPCDQGFSRKYHPQDYDHI
jgi:hypothetical protein